MYAEGGDLLVGHARAGCGVVVLRVLVDDEELVGEALLEEFVVPDESAAPFVHLRRVGGVDGVHGPASREAVAVAVVVASVVVERESVELRGLGGVQREAEHVRIAAARTHEGRAVDHDAVEAERGVEAVEEVLASDAEVEEAVEEPLALEPEVVQRHLVGEVVRAALALHAVLDEVLAELVHEASVQGELLVVELPVHARADAQVVDVLFVGARHHGARRAGQARHVVHDLFADAKVGSEGGLERGIDGLVDDGHVVRSRCRGAC